MRLLKMLSVPAMLAGVCLSARADVGDPQVRTDHEWYPGELACSTFERLFKTQADVYQRVVGRRPETDHDKVLASFLWRNTHYAHAEEANEDLWGQGFQKGVDLRGREYWTGLFSHGFGLCGTTHSQWSAEIEHLLGHSRGRGVGVDGHNSFEVFLTGDGYGAGRWALLDHDISTVIFDKDGKRLLSLKEVNADWKKLTDRQHAPERQQGWLVCGLHPGDGATYRRYDVAEYLPGYSGPAPKLHLRRGETLRRYLEPGLESGKDFVFWGRNYQTNGIPGPERSITWVNQPEKMLGSKTGAGYKPGQARFGNAVFTYRPDFASGDYKEGVVSEDEQQVTFEFQSPFLIGATPATNAEWGIYEPGGRNGLVIESAIEFPVSISTDRGKSWTDAGRVQKKLDLTDFAKGRRQYFVKLHAAPNQLAAQQAKVVITTVCQANQSVLPRLKDNGSDVTFLTSRTALVSAGPNLPQAAAHVVEGSLGTPRVTLELQTPRGEAAVEIVAAAHVRSSNPPLPEIKYQIEYSTDGGKKWLPIVRDWSIVRRGEEPADFWSQSMCYGSLKLPEPVTGPVRVRFRNDGGKAYARAEVHLVYRTPSPDSTRVTFHWTDNNGPHTASHLLTGDESTFKLPTGRDTKTKWIDFAVEPSASK